MMGDAMSESHKHHLREQDRATTPSPIPTAAQVPNRIWLLLNEGDQGEHVWCDCPDPDNSERVAVEYIRAATIPSPDADKAWIAELQAELDEARAAPWPKWAADILATIRQHSGYDGYDDATEGVDLPQELADLLSDGAREDASLRSALAQTTAEVERLTVKAEEWRKTANESAVAADRLACGLSRLQALIDELCHSRPQICSLIDATLAVIDKERSK